MANQIMTIDEVVKELIKKAYQVCCESQITDQRERAKVAYSLASWIGQQPMQMGNGEH